METMRDAFFNHLFPLGKADPEIMVLTSDFSAPSFDRWRQELPGQFLNTGIAEQNTILLASGLALEGLKVFVVSIAPFITMRCFEQIRLYPADLNLDVSIVGVGAGFSYQEAGATHHAVEDLGLMSLVPNLRIYSPSGNAQVRTAVDRIIEDGGPHYVRLDRRTLPELFSEGQLFACSLATLEPTRPVNFLTTGVMTHEARTLAETLVYEGLAVGLVDAFRLPLDQDEFEQAFSGTDLLITLEEHVAAGGLGSAARLALENIPRPPQLKSFSLDLSRGLAHGYGPRPVMQARHGLDRDAILSKIRNWMNKA